MPANISLAEFLAASERNLRSSILPTSYFAKQTYLQVADVFTATFGRKVWDALNNQTKFWNALRKVEWGPTVGWRNRTDRGAGRSRPVSETGALPTIDVSNYVTINSNPRFVATDFGVSVLGQLVSGLEGGMGDNLAVEQEAAARDHIKELNQEILLGGATIISTGGASATGAIAQQIVRIGDIFRTAGADGGEGNDTNQTITAISTAANPVLTFTGGETLADGEILYINTRAGFTSIDDIVEEDGRTVAGEALAVPGVRGVGVYNQTGANARGAGAWNAGAVVLDNDGVARNLALVLVDNTLRTPRFNGADPDLFLTGYDQYDRLVQILMANQRYLGWEEFVVKVGDEQTLPGTHTGLQVASYRGVPVLPDADVHLSVTAADADLGSVLYCLDTKYLEIAIAAPTQYIDNRDFFQANAFVLRGLFYTAGELRCYRFNAQAKVVDLAA